MARDSVDDVFREFHDLVNMGAKELGTWADSDNYDIYEEKKSGGEPIDKPREDIQRLLNTNKENWRDKDDGFNEVEEANQAISFINRMSAVEEGDPMPGTDPELSKRRASLLNWGHDSRGQRTDFSGDRRD